MSADAPDASPRGCLPEGLGLMAEANVRRDRARDDLAISAVASAPA